MELIRRFDQPSYQGAMESWGWIPELNGKTPAFASSFGDVFLQAADQSFWFLDLVGGSISQCAPDPQNLQAILNTSEGQDNFLMSGLAGAAEAAGFLLDQGQILSFKVPPVLGGAIDVENLEVADFVVAANLAGQLHQQVKDLPPGTSIAGFTVDKE